MRRVIAGVTAVSLALLLSSCGSSGAGSSAGGGTSSHSHETARHHSRSVSYTRYGSSRSTASRGPQPPSRTLGPRSKTHGCTVRGPLPDSACTPGSVFINATKSRICVLGYSRSVRNVSSSTKRTAYLEYGIASHTRGQYEVDHLVSLELGGSNSIANLWPEAAAPSPGFHQKDAVENYLHSQVCNGVIGLKQAQHEIATNWLAIYRKMPH